MVASKRRHSLPHLVHKALGRLLARVAAQAQVGAVDQTLANRQLRRVDVVLLHIARYAREALLLLLKTLQRRGCQRVRGQPSVRADIVAWQLLVNLPRSILATAPQTNMWRGQVTLVIVSQGAR